MKIPEAFSKIAETFHQDTHLFYNTLDEAARASVSELRPEEESIAKAYLDELLSGKYGEEQLVAIWLKTPAGSGGFGLPSPPQGFLSRIRAALEASLASRTSK